MPNQNDAGSPRELTKPEKFYVSAHFGLLTATAFADELGASVESVQAYLDRLKQEGVKPQEPRTRVEEAGFLVQNGLVSVLK